MSELSLYDVLEIHPTATEEAVRAAYFRLAKLYHPDLKRRDQKAEDTEKFIEINRAYTVLSDPAKRQVYDLQLDQRRGSAASVTTEPVGGQTPTAKAQRDEGAGSSGRLGQKETGRAFLKAEQLADAGRFADAARLLQAILRIEHDNAAYLSLAGYCLARSGENLHRARDYCRRAVDSEPYNATYLARLGFVYAEAHLETVAQRYFSEALAADPTQPLAHQYLSVDRRQKRTAGLLTTLRQLLAR